MALCWVSRYQKGKTNLGFTEIRDTEWQWYQLNHIIPHGILLQTDNHTSIPSLSFFYRMDVLLLPNQQHQITEGNKYAKKDK